MQGLPESRIETAGRAIGMAVIGNRIRQVLRILNTDGPCTAREVLDRMGLND